MLVIVVMPVKSEKYCPIVLSRRGFLTSLAGAAVTLAAPGVIASVAAPVGDRELSFYNIHTGEKLSASFWSDGNYLDDGIEQAVWMSYEDILSSSDRMRSHLVIKCIEQYQQGHRYPIGLVFN